MKPMMKLWKNETDTFVARDAEHAAKLYKEHIGGEVPYDAAEYGEWKPVDRPDDDLITIRMDEPAPNDRVTKTTAEWIADILTHHPDGGMLCSTEW